MWVRCKQACLLLFGFVLLLSALWGALRSVAAQDGSSWLANEAPSLSKVVELPANTQPTITNTDCTPYSYVPAHQLQSTTACVFASPIGDMTTSGLLQLGVDSFVRMDGSTSTFVPSNDPSLGVVDITSPQRGNYMGVYRHLTKASLRKNIDEDGVHYDISVPPDDMLRNPITHDPLQVNMDNLGFSANGEWMVVNSPGQGLVRVNMADLSTQLFAAPVEPSWYLGVAYPPLAISDDGRFVAANTDLFSTGNLKVYDLSTCQDQLNVAMKDRAYCPGKDIWFGQDMSGGQVGQGLLDAQPDMQYPTHLRFINDDSISFSARYGVEGSNYKEAVFVATAPGQAEHKLGLLGMGDSYISGQGEFDYKEGTDTGINTCHTSVLSYPFLLGKNDFDSYNSIACSGAETRNVSQKADSKQNPTNYTGQVTDKIEEKDRKKQPILANFQPGYIYQQEFASTYQPEAILLSIGGNDVGFADIVQGCVANQGGGTCYATYEDRAELVNEIDATYAKLVNTYTALRQQSGGARIYVVGYPQIAKPGGDCGINVRLNSDEVTFAAQLISYLDGVVQQAAQTAGVAYVDTQHAFDGHLLCEQGSKSEKAVNGLTAGDDVGKTIGGHVVNVIGAESYHPTVLGHQLLAKTIAQQTANLTAAMPAPKPYAVPAFDSAAPILQGVPSTGRKMNWVTSDDSIADGFVLRGDMQPVTVDGQEAQLQPSSKYQIVLHSDPILLDEGGVDADGNIATTVHIPPNVAPGYHVLHVYGTNMAGEAVDIQKAIYVAASADDYDGDGIPNSANACLVITPSGQDTDRDGIDDACDPDISDPPSGSTVSGQVTTNVTATTQLDGSVTVASPGNDGQTSPAQQSASSVLGDATTATVQSQNPQPNAANITLATAAQPLFRLNWLMVLKVGIITTTSATVAYYRLRRQ